MVSATLALPASHFRVRHDRVDTSGRITLRYLSRLHHIGIGRAHIGLCVHVLVANKEIRILREDGSPLRELTLGPSHDYQPLETKPGRPRLVHDDVRHASTMS